MNIRDILRNYTPVNKRDAWANTGSQYITVNTRTYIKNTLYRINIPSINLNNSLILSLENYSNANPIPWHMGYIVDEDNGYISFGNNIVNPYFSLILKGEDVLSLDSVPVNTSFVPYESPIYSVIISDDELDKILLEVGVPFIELEELEFSKEQIIDLMIQPALHEYFRWYPIIKTETIPLTSYTFEVPVPPNSFGAQRVFVSQGFSGNISPAPANPLLRQWDYLPLRHTRFSRNSPYNINTTFREASLQRAVRQGIVNYLQRLYFQVEKNEQGQKVIRGYSLKTGYLTIEWAYYSNKWEDIDPRYVIDVRRLACANVLRALGSLRSQVKSDIPGSIDFSSFLSRANELETAILTKWQEHTKSVAIRG